MSTYNIATRFLVVMLTPFWWGMGLLLLALLADLVPAWRGPIMRLFDGLEGKHPVSSSQADER